MRRKVGLFIIGSIIYAMVAGWYYIRIIKNKEFSLGHEIELPPISSNFSDSVVVIRDDLETFKSMILGKITANTVLEIKGYYDESELNTTSFANLGIARASYIRNIFDTMKSRNVRIVSEMIELKRDTHNFECVVIDTYAKNEYVEENSSGAFLFVSLVGEDQVDFTPELDAYLTYLSIEEKDKALDIIGHYYTSDSTGENTVNALLLASIVRQELIDKGMNDYQISAMSKGDSAPLYGTDSIDRIEVLINRN